MRTHATLKAVLVAAASFISLVLAGSSFAADAPVELRNSEGVGYVDIRAVSAKFRPARGMRQSERFDGFESSERSIEVVTALIRAPFDEIESNFTKETLKMRGVDVRSRTAVSINGHRGVLVKALHPDDGVNWGKWILIVENGGATLVVNGVFVSGDSAAAVDIEAMVKGVIPYGQSPND